MAKLTEAWVCRGRRHVEAGGWRQVNEKRAPRVLGFRRVSGVVWPTLSWEQRQWKERLAVTDRVQTLWVNGCGGQGLASGLGAVWSQLSRGLAVACLHIQSLKIKDHFGLREICYFPI